MKPIAKVLFLAAFATQMSSSVFAATITSASDPSLAGSTLINFESTALGNYSSGLTISGVTFGGSGSINVSNTYGGNYNTNGIYVDNNQGYTPTLTFQFLSNVSAFGFNLGAHDNSWTLQAFNSSNALLDTYTFGPIYSSNAGEFYGIAAAGIDHATLSTSGYDYVLLDNFRYVGDSSSSVPDGGMTVGLLGAVFAAFVGFRRKFSV